MADWREDVVNYLQVASILSAGGFATLALLTNYKQDGKVTRYGRFAVVGIVLSLLFSLGTRWVQSDLDRDRSRAASIRADGEREAERVKFRGQLGALVELYNLQHQSLLAQQQSQRTEQDLLAQANATIGAIEAARSQEDRNAAQTLHTMWDDANRIDLSSLVVRVAYSCDDVHGDDFPTLMDQGAQMSLRVARITDRQFADLSRMAFSTGLLVSDAFGVTLQSNEQHITPSPAPTSNGGHVEQVARFTSFLPRVRGPFADPGLGRFSEPANWRGAIVEANITAYQPRLVARAAAALGRPPEVVTPPRGPAPDVRSGGLRPGASIHSMSILPCQVQMILTVNGRSVAGAQGRLAEVREYPDDSRGLVVVKFPPVPVNATAFPLFPEPASRRSRAR